MTEIVARVCRRSGRPAIAALMRAILFRPGAAIIVAALHTLSPSAAAQAVVALDAQVKAAYLHKFPGFVEWPTNSFATPASPVLIGVAGEDAVYDELNRQAVGRSVQGRPVEVRKVTRSSSPNVHLLFIGVDVRREAAALLANAAGRAVLTVTDFPDGLTAGAVLNLVESGGRIRVEASLPAAAANHLKLSSRLLGVASRVVEATP